MAIAAAAAAMEEAGAAEAGAEAGESQAAFDEDSATNAASQGVDVQGIIKDVGEGVQAALNVLNLVLDIIKEKDKREEDRKSRYRAGVLFKNENRDQLIRDRRIPAYYSTSHIKLLLSENKLPYAWSELTAVNQGFEKEIVAGEIRKRNTLDAKKLVNRLKMKRAVQKNIDDLVYFKKKLKNNKAVEDLKTQLI